MDDPLQLAIQDNVSVALREDVGSGDVTADLIAESSRATAEVFARQAMTVAGRPWFDAVFAQVDPEVSIDWRFDEGDGVPADAVICTISGAARSILTAERTALNFLQLLSATATETSRYVAAVAGTNCRILDTRKTIPGLRQAQKYAVRCGGGSNHRAGLYDAILLKENHLASAGGIAKAVTAARKLQPNMPVEVEIESIEQLQEALSEQVERVMLDNFSLEAINQAVEYNARHGDPPAELEASGGMLLDDVVTIAETGVDYISIGALTKNVAAIDLSMRFK